MRSFAVEAGDSHGFADKTKMSCQGGSLLLEELIFFVKELEIEQFSLSWVSKQLKLKWAAKELP